LDSEFQDPNHEAAIRVAINKSNGSIYVADLEGLNNHWESLLVRFRQLLLSTVKAY
jgi:hypothetical protein